MKKLSKEKRMQLVLVAILTVGIIAGLWFGVITMQKDKLREIANKHTSLQQQSEKMAKAVKDAAEVEAALSAATNRLASIEGAMPLASGDLFSWINSSIKQFNVPSYKVDMPQFSSPSVGDVHMFSSFPYSQALVSVSGSAYYYEFGKFLADLENHFPYLRVQNLSLEPGFGSTAEEKEKLSFRMEIVTLVKPVPH
jgi:hypothetical protein